MHFFISILICVSATLNEKPSILSNNISKLSRDNIHSIQMAVSNYRILYKNASDSGEGLQVFRSFFYDVILKQNQVFSSLKESNMISLEKTNKNTLSYLETLSKNGIMIKFNEGMPYLDDSAGFLINTFAVYGNQTVKSFLDQYSIEKKEGFSEDAHLKIEFDKIRERIEFWDSFCNLYPRCVFFEEASYYYNIYLRVYLTGLDNFRIWDFESRKMLPKVRQSYEKALNSRKYITRNWYKILKGYYEMIKRNGFTYNDDYKIYLNNNKIESMLGYEPPF